MDFRLRLAVLKQAYKSLQEGDLHAQDKDDLLKLLDTLILALSKFSPPSELEAEAKSLAASLISSQSLLALARQQADELDALKKLSFNLTSNLDLPTVLDAVVGEAVRLVPKTRAVHIFLYVNDEIRFGASLDANGVRNKQLAEPRKEGLTYAVAKSGKIIIVDDMETHPLYKDVRENWSGSIIGIPLKTDTRVVGVMNLSKDTAGGFSPAELSLLNMLADQAAIAIANTSLLQALSRKAYNDTVTGLPNRRALDERLEAEIINARRLQAPFAVVMMDLDGFKKVNDTYGHDLGDRVLRAVFNVVAVGIRGTDFIARYGGDELTLILSQSDVRAARLVTEKILENLEKFAFKAPDGSSIRLGISGGIAVFPTHGQSGSALLRAADAALYHAKKHQRGTFVIAAAATGPLNPLAFKPTNNEGE